MGIAFGVIPEENPLSDCESWISGNGFGWDEHLVQSSDNM